MSGLAAHRAIGGVLLQKTCTTHSAPTTTMRVWLGYINIYTVYIYKKTNSEVEFSL